MTQGAADVDVNVTEGLGRGTPAEGAKGPGGEGVEAHCRCTAGRCVCVFGTQKCKTIGAAMKVRGHATHHAWAAAVDAGLPISM